MKLYLLAALAVLVFVASPALAQGGCVNSPENPTAVLALVGSAGAAAVAVRNRIAARRLRSRQAAQLRDR